MKAGNPSMRNDSLKYLCDVRVAAKQIRTFIADRTFDEYKADAMLSSAVERQFEIIGEALNQLQRRDPDTTACIRSCQQAISFRNILIHGYVEIDAEIVWRVIQDDLPALQDDVATLMDDEPAC